MYLIWLIYYLGAFEIEEHKMLEFRGTLLSSLSLSHIILSI